MLGYHQRYAYQAPPSVGVDSGVTSISLLTQTARPLATPANMTARIAPLKVTFALPMNP
jgi:hypothetical protein